MPKSLSCPKCGASLPINSAYCNYCGAMIVDVNELLKSKAQLELQKQKDAAELARLKQLRKNNKKGLDFDSLCIILGVGTAVLVIIGIIIIGFRLKAI